MYLKRPGQSIPEASSDSGVEVSAGPQMSSQRSTSSVPSATLTTSFRTSTPLDPELSSTGTGLAPILAAILWARCREGAEPEHGRGVGICWSWAPAGPSPNTQNITGNGNVQLSKSSPSLVSCPYTPTERIRLITYLVA